MEAVLIYLLKASGLLAIFCLAYQLFLKKETFFAVNRHFLIFGILTASLLPFVTIPNYIEITSISIENEGTGSITSPMTNVSQQTGWAEILFAAYLIGLALLTTKFIIQLLSLYKLIRRSKVDKQGKFYHVETNTSIAPFSFFNHIFYNPTLYSQSELSAIVRHEKAHSSQWHSIDVIISHIITICTWMNPFSWLYQTNIKQNLEFLADKSAIKEIPSVKKYQYTLLKVSGNQFYTPIVNNFYNSLIKKRIIMLNKSKSNKKNIFKIALILPALAIFLVSFNTKDVYIPPHEESKVILKNDVPSKIIEITIDKNTTDKELNEIKKDLAKKGVDFSYTVVHNSNKEITDISIDFTSKKEDGKKMRGTSTFNNDDGPIEPIHIIFDLDSNTFAIGSDKGINMTLHEDQDVHEETEYKVWVHSDTDDEEKLQTIEIIDENGEETIKVNGKKVTRKELKKMKEKDGVQERHIKIRKHKDGDKHVYIMKDSHHEVDFDQVIGVEEGKGKTTFLINTDDDKILHIIDGKESKQHDMKLLDPSDIKSISVLKGESAKAKYGKKGKDGVIEITTEKKKN
jgi:bla regulator protein blaR1